MIMVSCHNKQANTKTDYSAPKINKNMKTSGTPITSKNIVDVMEIKRITSSLTNGCDNQQWEVIRDILTEEVNTTIGEEKGKSRVKPKEEIISRWKGFFESADNLIIHHVTSNERILFEGAKNANVYSKGVIVVKNTPAGEYAKEGGSLVMNRWVEYEFGAIKTDAGWKVNKVLVKYLVEEAKSIK